MPHWRVAVCNGRADSRYGRPILEAVKVTDLHGLPHTSGAEESVSRLRTLTGTAT
jgi:hypothetical protein